MTEKKQIQRFVPVNIVESVPPVKMIACALDSTFCIDMHGDVWVIKELFFVEKREVLQLPNLSNICEMSAPYHHVLFRDYMGKIYFYGWDRFAVFTRESRKARTLRSKRGLVFQNFSELPSEFCEIFGAMYTKPQKSARN